LIWCGDLNVAHLEIDLKNPKQNKNKTAGFTDEERANFSKVLESGFVDSFRHLYPNEEGAYTFWSYSSKGARESNIGWRLDYHVISKKLVEGLGDCYRRPSIEGSDHCPLVLHMNIASTSSNNNNNNHHHHAKHEEKEKKEGTHNSKEEK